MIWVIYMITYNYKVNMTPGGIAPRCKLNQYDDDWTIVFSLYSDIGEFTIQSGTTAKIRGTKKDVLGYSANATIDISNQKVTVTGDKQITAVAGENTFELVLYKGEKELSTANIIFYVEPAAMDSETLVSDSQVQEILDMSAEVIAASNNVNTLRGNFAPTYSSSATYAVGDYAVYNNQLYRCITAITTAEAWTAGHWTAVALGGDVSNLKSDLISVDAEVDSLRSSHTLSDQMLDSENGAITDSAGNQILDQVVFVNADVVSQLAKRIADQEIIGKLTSADLYKRCKDLDELSEFASRDINGLEETVDSLKDNVDVLNDLEETVDSLKDNVDVLNDGGLVLKDDVISDQVQDWLDEHPEATTTVQDGSISSIKLARDIYLEELKNLRASSAKQVPLSQIGVERSSGYAMQGACYNSSNNRIIMAFHETENPTCILKELDANFNEVRSVELMIYHANDITYCPVNNLYYVADGENNNKIYTIDADALTLEDTIVVPIDAIIRQISFDEVNGFFYIMADQKVYTCSIDFSETHYLATISVNHFYDNIRAVYIGGSCMLGETFLSQYWLYGNDNQTTSYTRLYFVRKNKEYNGYYFDFPSLHIYDEAESILAMPGKLLSVGYLGDFATIVTISTGGVDAETVTHTSGNIYKNSDLVPVNSCGNCTIKASSSPTNQDITGPYVCYGDGANRTLRITVGDTDYFRIKTNGTWSSWLSNKTFISDYIVTRDVTIVTDDTINANTSTSEYIVDVPDVNGYMPILVTHKTISSPVVFVWYLFIMPSVTSESGYIIKARYRNTNASAQSNVNITVTVTYVKSIMQ